MRRGDGHTQASTLTKEGIVGTVMWGQHVMNAEKAFVLNGYRSVRA